MHESPLVSILMTAYNREEFIAEAIVSVLASNYTNWELIVTDDCSSDSTFYIAEEYAKKDKRIQVYRNESNLGDYPNRNRAAAYAKGFLLIYVDSDDLLHSDTIDKCVALFNQYPNVSFGILCPYIEASEVLNPKQAINWHFFHKPLFLIGPGGTVIKNSYFKEIGGFPTKYGPANDGYYNLKAASGANTVIFPFPTVNYRIHDGQEINNKYSYLYNSYRYLRDALIELDLPLSEKDKVFLLNKNRRRFLINILKFFRKTKDLERTNNAVYLAQFKFKDVLSAVFH
jgi:glycosyltransferase involved in cell wall biosynthesis